MDTRTIKYKVKQEKNSHIIKGGLVAIVAAGSIAFSGLYEGNSQEGVQAEITNLEENCVQVNMYEVNQETYGDKFESDTAWVTIPRSELGDIYKKLCYEPATKDIQI